MGGDVPNADAAPEHLGPPKFSGGEETEPPTRLAGRTAEPAAPHNAAQSPSTVSTATSTSQSETLSEVSGLLSEFRVLLRHVVDGGIPNARPTGGQIGTAGQEKHLIPFPSGVHTELLTRAPGEIASDATLLQQLYSSVAILSGLAAPATVSSICLTSAFLHDRKNSNAPAEAKSAARRLRRWAITTVLLALLVFIVTIMLFVHVDRGRRIVQQLEYQLVVTAIDQARNPNLAADCAKEPDASDPQVGGNNQPVCERLRDALRRMRIVRTELRAWNAVSDRLSFFWPKHWLYPHDALPERLREEQWEASELRASAIMAGFTGFVLPMLLGLLGAFTYVYRDIDRRVRTATLLPVDGAHSTLRILLGMTLGGLLGVIWTNGQPIQLEGVTLSLAVLAFFVGFGVEVVLRILDSIVARTASALQK